MSIEAGTASRKHNLLVSVRNRILRWTLNILSALSLLLCGVVIAFWIRGQFKGDWFQWHKTDPQANTWRAADMVSGRSGFYFSWQAFYFERPGHVEEYSLVLKRINGFGHMESQAQSMPYRGSFWNRLGFGARWNGLQSGYSGSVTDRSNFRYSFDGCHVPYWFILLLLGLGGLRLIVRTRAELRRRQRLRDNQCLACGYDLRGSSGRCPECGQPANR